MYKRMCLVLVAGGLLWAMVGCVSVTAPEKIEMGGRAQPEPVDSSQIPPTASHEEARQELTKAYRWVKHVERENEDLRDKADEYKRERDKYKKERDRYKDRLEKYEDD
ncbi:MAG: hypothetical protein ABIG44_11905 [Planctomycetota bacterium]